VSASVAEKTVTTRGDQDWRLNHRYHKCNPDVGPAIAVCGERVILSGLPPLPGDTPCVVCIDISDQRYAQQASCPLCGEKYPPRRGR
jgi:hypothetical protein